MDEEEELENMLIGRNQRRTNTRPEEIRAQNSQAGTSGTGNFAEGILQDVVEGSPAIAAAKFVQESPIVKGMQGKIPSAIRKFGLPFFSFSKAGGRGILPLAAFGAGYGAGRAIDEGSKFLPGMGGEELSTKLARGMAPEVFENENLNSQPAFNAPTLQDLANQRAQGAITEDDKVDNLQKSLQSVPDTPQVVPGTLPTAQESGQRLIDAAKEFYPGAFEPAAPAGPALPDPARTALTTEQMQGLSPDALQAIRTPSIPESVTSAEVPAGLGPMRPVDPRTGEFLSPEVIAAGEGAGFTFPSQVALPQEQAPIAPMSEAETKARLQSRFGAPTISQIQALPEGQGRGTAVDAQGRMIPRTAQPQESEGSAETQKSQTQKDTAAADKKVTRSVSAQGRAYTDSELRRAFGDDGYQEARIKDANGINPFTDLTYEQEKLNRENLIADTEARKRSNVDDPDSPAKVIEDARAQAEAMAEASGLSPDDPDYDDFILDSMETITGIPRYRKPIPRLTDAEANALYEKGEIGIGYEYINEKGERGKYEPEEKAAESEGKKDPRSRAAEARKNR
jgi:hypothetical protein